MKHDTYYTIIIKAFNWLNNLAEKKYEIKKADLEEFFTEDLEINTNNLPLVGLDKFQEHLKESLSQYTHSKVILPFKAYVRDEKKAALYYFLKSTAIDGQVFEYCVMSIFKFRSNKISSWYEVVSEINQR
jgi:hypothetical protein